VEELKCLVEIAEADQGSRVEDCCAGVACDGSRGNGLVKKPAGFLKIALPYGDTRLKHAKPGPHQRDERGRICVQVIDHRIDG